MKTHKTESNKNANVNSLMRVTCPKCKNGFGLDRNIVENYNEVNIHYTCPYCGYDAGLKNNA